jgi:hypothetical protein
MPFVENSGGGGSGSGTVTSVTATDTSIVVAGTAVAPTIATGTLDAIAAAHPAAANWSNNSKKITGLANGSAAADAAAFGQIPTRGTIVASAAVTANVTVTSTTEATPDLIISLGAATYTNALHIIEVFWPASTPTGAAVPIVQLWDDTTLLRRIWQDNLGTTALIPGATVRYRLTPSAGSHTYKVMAYRSGGTQVVFNADNADGSAKFGEIQMCAYIA